MMRFTMIATMISASGLMLLAGCASGGGPGTAGGDSTASTAPRVGEGKHHTVTAAEQATAHGSTPIAGEYAKLWINGMGCPQCVSNIDLQLERQLSASDVKVDLKDGIVYARFAKSRPTPDQINQATEDAGLTLAKVESSATPLSR